MYNHSSYSVRDSSLQAQSLGENPNYTEEKLTLHHKFFEALIREFNLQKIDADIVAVLHILPDAIPFTHALQKIATIRSIIPKPKSINLGTFETLRELPFIHLTRQNIRNIIGTLQRKTVFLDIGGYFSSITQEIYQATGDNFSGIVEDTENGMQKYESKGIDFPFISVARSPLKENEDTMVGQAIAYSTEAILRQHGIVMNGLRVGVIGYGKVGRSVARNIEQKQGKVSIYDTDHIRLTHAVSSGFNVIDRQTILRESDIVCLATGNKSLSKENYSELKSGSWLFSVTSSDDELDKEWLEEHYKREQVSRYVAKYSRGKHYFYLLNDGNAINFIHGTTVGDFILLVHAEILVAAYRLMTHQAKIGEYEIDTITRDKICEIWLSHFRMKEKHS